jgi:lipoate-protein ligase A
MDTGKLILSGALPGQSNMDLDESLLTGFPPGGRPVLRLYRWSPPALSLGYFQKPAEVADLELCRRRGIQVVRRPTGGGAILHDRELTLSLFLPLSHPLLDCPLEESYLRVTRPLAELCRAEGAEVAFRGGARPARHAENCFAGSACPDLVFDGRKLFGSAQRRKGGAMLFHGSLLLGLDRPLWEAVFQDRLGEGFTCLEEVLGRPVAAEGLVEPLVRAYERLLGCRLLLDKTPPAC